MKKEIVNAAKLTVMLTSDIAELDGGTVAKTTFPNEFDMTSFVVIVKPDRCVISLLYP